jgi:hypothetical protein
MASTTPPAPAAATADGPRTPASVIVAARESVRELQDCLWAAKAPLEKLDVVSELEKFKSEIAAIEAELLTEIDVTKAAAHDQWGCAGDFVTAASGGYRGSGQSRIRLARALTADFPPTLEALRAAKISRNHAEVIVHAVDALPSKRAMRDVAEQCMLEQAVTMNASDLREFGKALAELLDPDGAERKLEKDLERDERAAHHSRFLALKDDGSGGVWIKGRTTVEDAGIIKKALFSLAGPQPGCPGVTGDPSRCDPGLDPRDHGARLLDALVEGCRRLMGAELLPECHGATPRLTLTMSYDDLVGLLRPGMLDTGESLSAWAVRRLACDADITPMVLGSHSEILDVGRSQRLVTPAIWKALVARDRHCCFPGCRRPPIACDAHHLQHWLDGGVTALDNLCLLCRAHHAMLHNTPWEVRMNSVDKRPEFIPPIRIDPQRRPMRERPLRT